MQRWIVRNKFADVPKILGITFYRIAKETGLHREFLYRLAKNPNIHPSSEIVMILMKVYGLTLEQLMEIEEWKLSENIKSGRAQQQSMTRKQE